MIIILYEYSMVKISELIGNPDNPRVIKDDRFMKLVNSLRRDPQIMTKRGIIIESWDKPIVLCGNQRLKALVELGYKEIPETWVQTAEDLTPEQRKRLVVLDNVQAGEFDPETLNQMFDPGELDELGVTLDMEIAGMEELESRSGERGGFITEGLKLVIGTYTKFIEPDHPAYEGLCNLSTKLLEMDEDEKEKFIKKLCKL